MSELKRPTVLHSITKCVKTPCLDVYVTVGFNAEGQPIEVLCRSGKNGQCVSGFINIIGRLITIALRNRTPASELLEPLKGTHCSRTTAMQPNTCMEEIAKAVESLVEAEK